MAKVINIAEAFKPGIEAATHGAARCKDTFKAFLKKHPPAKNYKYGPHTNAMIEVGQNAVDAVRRGENKYYILNCPFRHGKSDIISRRLPPYILACLPDYEVMLATYAAELSEALSIHARRCYMDAAKEYSQAISDEQSTKERWNIKGARGGMSAIGLGGAVTGFGAHFLIVDDYCKNRQEAESEARRDMVWDSFRNDLMTRLSPEGHAVIVTATRWHDDDLVARIEAAMADDEAFPKFEKLVFPAWDEKTGWLFPERISAKWYEAQKATLGDYAFQALMQQQPVPRGGALFKTDNVQIVEAAPEGLVWTRSWDLASTEKQRLKDNPDYTVGALVAVDQRTPDIEALYIRDIVRGQWSAPERDAKILQTARTDARGTRILVEGVAGYKDTVMRVKAALRGFSVVTNFRPEGDKLSRATVLEPFFDGKRIFLVKADWNEPFTNEAKAFPRGKKDDQIDAVSGGVLQYPRAGGGFKLSR